MDFHETFYRAAAINNWSDQLMALIVPSYLAGRAKDVYLNFAPATKANTSKVFDALECHFNSSAIRYMAKTQVHERTQKTGESVSDYYQNVSVMVRKAWGGANRDIIREKLTECFIRGLRQPVKKIFFDREPSSIEEALREAEGREIYLKSKQRAISVNNVEADRRSSRGGAEMDQNIREEGDRNNRGGGNPDRKNEEIQLEAIRREMADMKIRLQQKDDELANQAKRLAAHQRPEPPAPRSPSPAPRHLRFDAPSCWACGSKAHFRAECPNKGGNGQR